MNKNTEFEDKAEMECELMLNISLKCMTVVLKDVKYTLVHQNSFYKILTTKYRTALYLQSENYEFTRIADL